MNIKAQHLFKFCWGKLPKYSVSVRHLQTVENIVESSNENNVTVEDNLKALSLPYTTGFTCFLIKDCSVCPDYKDKSSGKSNIFINKRTGFFLCSHCNISGNWDKFSDFINKAKDGKDITFLKKTNFLEYNKNWTTWESILKESTFLKDESVSEVEKVFENFQLPKINKDILKKLQVRINKSKDVLYFPIQNNGRTVGFKTLDLTRKSTTYPKTECPGCLIYSTAKKSAVTVATIHDFFALLSQKLPHDIICLPYGVSNLPQNTLPFLEHYQKIILWLGEWSLHSINTFANKLDCKRCHIIRSTENQTSAEIALLQKEDIDKIISNAKSMCHDHIVTFHSLRDEVLSELQNKDVMVGVQWQRFPKLNQILKGHRRGELSIITGPTGVGKTTFMSEYSLDLACQGVNTLWGSFEIKNTRLAKIMLQQFSEKPLSENVEEFNELANKFEELPIFFMTFHGQQDISTVMDAVEHCSYNYDIAHVVIDNVQFMIELGYKVDRFWKQDYLVQAFRNFASKNNCHVTLVMHPRKEDDEELGMYSIFGGVKAIQEADNVLIIQKRTMGLSSDKRYLQVYKNRYSGDLGSLRLYFDKKDLSFRAKSRTSFPYENNNFKFREKLNLSDSFDSYDRDSEIKVNF